MTPRAAWRVGPAPGHSARTGPCPVRRGRRQLARLLGLKVTAGLAGARDPRIVRSWISGEREKGDDIGPQVLNAGRAFVIGG